MDEKFSLSLINRVSKDAGEDDQVVFVYDENQPIRFGLIKNKLLYTPLERLIVNWGGVVDTYRPNNDDDFNIIIGYDWEDYNDLPDKITSFQFLLECVKEGKTLKADQYSLTKKKSHFSEKEDKTILKAIEATKDLEGYEPKNELLWDTLEKCGIFTLFKRTAKSLKNRYERQLKDSKLNINDVEDARIFNLLVYLEKQGINLDGNNKQDKSINKSKGKVSSTSKSKANTSREVSREKSKAKSREVSKEKSREKSREKNKERAVESEESEEEKKMSIDLDEPETQNPNVLLSSEEEEVKEDKNKKGNNNKKKNDNNKKKNNNKNKKDSKKGKNDKLSKEDNQDSKEDKEDKHDSKDEDISSEIVEEGNDDDEEEEEEYIEDSQDRSREYGSNKTLHNKLQKQRDNSLSISPISRKRKSSESPPKKKSPKKKPTKRKLIYQESFLSKNNEILDISIIIDKLMQTHNRTTTEVLRALYICNGNLKKVEKYLNDPENVKHWSIRDDRCIVNQEYKKIADKWSMREIDMRKRWLFQN